MNKYVIEEQSNLYEVLLYSDNPILINELSNKLKKENIILKVKKINKNNAEKYESIDKHNNPVKVIVDLTEYRFMFENNDHITNPHGDNFIFILNKSFKRNYRRSAGNINNVIYVDKITKISATKIAGFLISVLAGKNQKSIDLTKKRNIFLLKKYKYLVLLSILFLAIFIPYILNIYSLLSDYFFDKAILQKVSLIKAKEICNSDKGSKKFIKGVISNYTKIPYISVFFQKPFTYSSRSYSESVYLCDLISYIDKINSTIRTSIFDRNFTVKGSVNTITPKPQDFFHNYDFHPRFNERFRDYNKEIFLFSGFFNLVDNNLYSPQKKNFLLLFQNSNVLTPTGGLVEEIIVFSTEGGKLLVGDNINPSKLNQLFKGRVGNFVYPDTPFINYDYDRSLTLQDKYKILKTVFSESFNINISGIISVEQRVLGEIVDTGRLLIDKDASLFKSLENYKNTLSFLKSGNINFFFEQNSGFIESKDIILGENETAKECSLDIKVVQEIENNSERAVTKVKVVGKKEDNVFRLAFNFSGSDVGTNDLLLIKTPKGALYSTIGKKTVSSYKSGKEEYLLLNPYRTNNTSDIEFINNIGACKNGFSVLFEKQPGNDSVQIDYDYITDSEYNMYLDGTLTGRGNKFYNTQSFNLLRDTVFFFVK